MFSRRYSGKRISGGHSGFAHDRPLQSQTAVRLLFFPFLMMYLELVLHISMHTALRYTPIHLVFGAAAGCLLTALTIAFPRKVNNVLTKVFAGLWSLIFVVEIICKKILQSYYPLSSLGTAAGNRLSDYLEVIVSTVFRSLPLILICFLPFLLLLIFGSRWMGYHKMDVRMAGLMAVCMVVLHLLGLGVVHLPWKGDLVPKQLYHMDSNIDDQVEQLGMINLLRLDVKHMIIPAENTEDSDFSDLEQLNKPEEPAEPETPATPEAPDPEEPAEPEVPVEPELPPEPVIDTSPNVMDIDFASVAANTKNDSIKWLAEYYSKVTPTKKNEYTGMFKGYNVVQFVVEGFSGYVIDEKLTPTLYRLQNEGFVFDNFYTPLHFTSTSNGECQTLLSLYPKNGMPITMKRAGELDVDLPFTLAHQLKREGYQVLGYHGNSNMYGRYDEKTGKGSHVTVGYDWRQHNSGLSYEKNDSGKALWPQRDSYVVEASVDDFINSDQPFHVYYLTISGHMPYSNNRIVKPFRDTVRQLPYTETTQNYIATAMEFDRAVKTLIDKLDAAGKLDNTLFVATPDHIPYFDVATLEELAGKKFGSSDDIERLKESSIDFDVYKSSLLLWSSSMKEPVHVHKVCGQVDILPTVSNLLGLEYDSRLLTGQDILSDSEGLVIFSSRCWKSDKGLYNRYTQEFTPAEGVTMTEEEQKSYVSAMKKLVSYKLECTPKLIENDFYSQLHLFEN